MDNQHDSDVQKLSIVEGWSLRSLAVNCKVICNYCKYERIKNSRQGPKRMRYAVIFSEFSLLGTIARSVGINRLLFRSHILVRFTTLCVVFIKVNEPNT